MAAVMRTCDLVMKGGITSGVVYAGAIAELGRAFRFKRIGGTSAGAIGAAELWRRRPSTHAPATAGPG